MKLNVLVLGQRDPRWASQRLGTVNGTTIGGYGCIITCMSMLASYYGHPTNPDQMDNWLTDNQGYVQGNLYRNDAFGREFSDCKFDRVVFCTAVPAPLNQIDDALAAGHPVVVMVDFDHDPHDGIQTHFVLIVGREDNGDYIINDPWFGDQVYFKARYGDQAAGINQINFFGGPVFVPAAEPLIGLDKEVGYKPNVVGQDVMVNGVHYRSVDGKAWEIVPPVTPPTPTADPIPTTPSQIPTPTLPPVVKPKPLKTFKQFLKEFFSFLFKK